MKMSDLMDEAKLDEHIAAKVVNVQEHGELPQVRLSHGGTYRNLPNQNGRGRQTRNPAKHNAADDQNEVAGERGAGHGK